MKESEGVAVAGRLPQPERTVTSAPTTIPEPSLSTSCTTLPLLPLTALLTSRNALRWSLIGPNWPTATAAYSPSVANSHG
ncbi:MAG: hypothetical protein ACR2I4_07375 [Actinomycetota bacterium]